MGTSESRTITSKEQLLEAARVCACFNFRKAARAVTQLFDGVLQPSGLRSTQLVILMAIHADKSIRLPDLARDLNVDRSTLTRNLQPLDRAGLIKITAGKDSRASTVKLSPKGRRLLERTMPLWEKAQERFEAQVGSRRWKAMVRELSTIVDAAHNA